jgi:hypothetical protein
VDRGADSDHRRDRTGHHRGDALHRVDRPAAQPDRAPPDRPRLFRTRFDSWLLRGVEQAMFEDHGHDTRLTQEFWINGIISRLMGRIWALGSYRGSFRGELKSFVRLAEREARSSP